MPELIVYDKRHNRIHVNSPVKWRGMQCVVTQLISSQQIKLRRGGIVDIASTRDVEVLTRKT